MTNDTRLTLRRQPATNPVKLVFGEREGLPLSFWRPPVATPGPVKLVFGDDGTAPPEAPSVTLTAEGQITGLRGKIAVYVGASVQAQGVLTGLRGHVTVRAGSVLRASGVLTGLRLRIATRYDIDVQRPIVGNTATHWRDARTQTAGTALAIQGTQPQPSGWHVRWQHAIDAAASIAHPLPGLLRATWHALQPRHQDAARLHSATALAHQIAAAMRLQPHSRFQSAHPLCSATQFLHQEGARTQRLHSAVRWQLAQPLHQRQASSHHIARPYPQHWRVRYQDGVPPPPGRWTAPPPPPGPGPCYVPTLPALLLFADPFEASLPARLIFKCDGKAPGPQPGTTVVVPLRRIYMTLNDITLTRADTGESIPAYTFGMSIDVDSWTWQWSATLHHAALPLIVPGSSGDPVDVLASINGTPYRLVVENYSRNRSFGQTRIAVTGRGHAAILDAPYAPTLNHASAAARTARQLMQDALTINGVGIGWDIDWRLTDWLVPGSIWAHQGSYISAILDIASAAGGYVQPHNTAPTLRILPRYPAAPWHWDTLTPDFELPSAVVAVEGIEWQRKAPYDRIYVSGTTGEGVLGQVTRAGRAGGSIAPMVTHPLITHADAARQRGMAELGDTGRQAHISLKLPVLQETGVIQPGALVRYVDGGDTHLGLVRSTSVDWSRPTLRQTLSVETHPV